VTDVVIAGSAMTRFGKFPDATIRTMAEEAVKSALDDAALSAADVGIVFFSNAVAGLITGQEMIRGQVALRHTGLLGKPIINVENACASASTAFHLAVAAVASGSVDVALAVGSEKLTHPDKARSFAAIGTAVDLFEIDELKLWIRSEAADSTALTGAADDSSRSFFMDVYAANARAYMNASGATVEDFARVSVKSRAHAALNSNAQYRTPTTVEEVLASRLVAHPLTVLMCSPIGDGAAAVVVSSSDRARRSGADPVRVRASILTSGTDHAVGEPGSVERASALAFDRAGVGPEDLDVLEVHDAAASAELVLYEELGLCPAGCGPALLRSGATKLGGRHVVNPSGGLLSKGHPIGATGCAQIVELADQLRGRCGGRQVPGARTALAENGGGFLATDNAAMAITVLSI
jgi:acetyl-CoA acetyltransferase